MKNQPTPQEEFQLAQCAFDQKDLKHAIFHLSWALAGNAEEKRYLDLLHKIIKQTRNPLDLIPMSNSMSYAEVAVRAYMAAQQKDLEHALYLLFQVFETVPAAPYFPWLVSWFSNSKNLDALSQQAIFGFFGRLSHLLDTNPQSRPYVSKLIPALEAYCQKHNKDGVAMGLVSTVLRRLGQGKKAIEYAQRGYQLSPISNTAIFLGGAYRDAGNVDAAIKAYQQALTHDPSNDEIRLDIADLLCERGDLDEGITYYEQVASRNPDHPWAVSHLYFYQYQRDRNPAIKDRLKKYVDEHPDNPMAAELLGRLGDPFIDNLPEPTDATIGILRKLVAENNKPKTGLNMGLSAMETPSARMAVEMYCNAPMTVSIADIQSPDPRQPRRDVQYILWRYKGTDPVAAVNPPSLAVSQQIARLANQPYSLDAWITSAQQIADQLGADRLNDLLGVMVHPPEPQGGIPIWYWIYRVQVAAALTIAYLDDGWDGSLRKEALTSIALGPMDWTVDAALIALLVIARENPDSHQDIIAIYQELLDNPPQPGAILYLGALIHCGFQLPGLPEAMRQRMEEMKEWV
ncbi:MAG: tetratricopeptide repeat protein [Anaerolineae bacterium]|nr:tetratricopeptide repeat protein [Anaerolineae bacterium]